MKSILIILPIVFMFGCSDGNPEIKNENKSIDSSSLEVIEKGSNFSVYLLKRGGNEYLLVNGVNGVAICKHR